jgi:hypothetical protein
MLIKFVRWVAFTIASQWSAMKQLSEAIGKDWPRAFDEKKVGPCSKVYKDTYDVTTLRFEQRFS